MKTSNQGRAFVEGWESLRLAVYRDSAGLLTVGYGHLCKAGEGFKLGDVIAQTVADSLMINDLRTAEAAINLVPTALDQNEFDALVSLVFNIGIGNWATSTIRKFLVAGVKQPMADEFRKWNKVHDPATNQMVVSDGLSKRREAERDIFLAGVYDSSH